MSGRPGFLLGFGGGAASESDLGRGVGSVPPIGAQAEALVGPGEQGGLGGAPGSDPVWGALRPPLVQEHDPWLTRPSEVEFVATGTDAEIFCEGFQISGQLDTGQFGRLSDWINMQSGFISVRNASIRHLGEANGPNLEGGTTQWIRLEGIALVAERVRLEQSGPRALVVPKLPLRVSMLTSGYRLDGSMHVLSDGSVSQYLAAPDSHFLPITDVTVRSLSDPTLAARFPFALVNRDHLVAIVNRAVA
jgi:hypothetical protein